MKSNTLVLAVMPYNFSLCRPRGSDLASEWRELPGREDQYQPRRRHRPAQEGFWVILCCDTQLFFFVCFRISYHVPPPYLRGPFRRYGTIQFWSLVKYIWSMFKILTVVLQDSRKPKSPRSWKAHLHKVLKSLVTKTPLCLHVEEDDFKSGHFSSAQVPGSD